MKYFLKSIAVCFVIVLAVVLLPEICKAEDGNTYSEAIVIKDGEIKEVGEIERNTSIWFTYTLPDDGSVSFSIENSSYVIYSLYDASMELISSKYSSERKTITTAYASKKGTKLYLLVTSANFIKTYNYKVSVSFSGGMFYENEPNNDLWNAKDITDLENGCGASFSSENDVDYYKVVMPQDGYLSFGIMSNFNYAKYEIYDEANKVIASGKNDGNTITEEIGGLKKGQKVYIKLLCYVLKYNSDTYSFNSSNTYNIKANIIPVNIAIPYRVSILKGKNQFSVSWSMDGKATGYQIKYSKKNNMTSAKTINSLTSKKIIKGLSKGKYYVRIRAYVTMLDGSKMYGKWSSKKVVKV